MTDLANFITNDENWLELEHPVSGAPLGTWLKLASSDSEVHQKELRKQRNKRLKKGMRKITTEELENEAIELLAASTLEWKTIEDGQEKPTITLSGDELECNKANARKLYKTVPEFKEQVDNFVGERGNFLGE